MNNNNDNDNDYDNNKSNVKRVIFCTVDSVGS